MKFLTLFALAVVLCFGSSVVGGGDKKKPPLPLEKWNFDLAEKTWGLKVKSMDYNEGNLAPYNVLFEFTKDLQPEQLKKLREAFPSDEKIRSKTVAFFFFDKDNVVTEKQSFFFATSELTGAKGDRFRLLVRGSNNPHKVVKVELRVIK